MLSIDLNCDMGESTHLWPYDLQKDHLLLPFLSSVNLACGFHAGDAHTMHDLVNAALTAGLAVGAHPGFDDRENFGRTNQTLSPERIYDIIIYQLGALEAFVKVTGRRLHHVKPHGALYNMAAKEETLAAAIAKAVYDYDKRLVLYALSGSKLIQEAKAIGLTTCSEVFADRTYQDDGQLTPRTHAQALIQNSSQALQQVWQMVQKGTVTSITGKEVPVTAETICIHGDGLHAVEFARAIHDMLKNNNVVIHAMVNRQSSMGSENQNT